MFACQPVLSARLAAPLSLHATHLQLKPSLRRSNATAAFLHQKQHQQQQPPIGATATWQGRLVSPSSYENLYDSQGDAGAEAEAEAEAEAKDPSDPFNTDHVLVTAPPRSAASSRQTVRRRSWVPYCSSARLTHDGD